MVARDGDIADQIMHGFCSPLLIARLWRGNPSRALHTY